MGKGIESELNVIKITENIREYEDIGVVKYIYNRKARNFAIRINQAGQIRVTVPRYGSMRRAEYFFLERKHWVEEKLSEIKRKNSNILVLKEGTELRIRDKLFVLTAGTNGGDLESAFWKILLREAKTILPSRIEEIASLHDLSYKDLKIKKMKSRWGSCSSGNSINLNSWLILLPDHLINYVILHELAHTIHKNHSQAFWNELQKLSQGRARLLRKELRNYRIMYRVEK